MPNEPTNFRVETSDYLGIKHKQFRDNMLGLALSKPTEYFKLRNYLVTKLKLDAIDSIYMIYYNLLTQGKDGSETPSHILAESGLEGTTISMFVPCYPKQKVNEFAMGVSETLEKIAQEAIDILMPDGYEAVAKERISTKSKGAHIIA